MFRFRCFFLRPRKYPSSARTSEKGSKWEIESSNTSKDLYKVVYGDGIYVVVGREGIILNSQNGNLWRERYSPTDKSLRGLTYFEYEFYK